jgi:hypothetical protein
MATVLERSKSMAERRPDGAPRVSPRVSSRARGRLALGLLVVSVGVLINLAIFRGLDHKSSVLQLNRDVPAGQQIRADDFRTVEIGSDGSFRSVPARDVTTIVGSYAKVRLIAGTLLAREATQTGPLVAAGASVVAVTVPASELPIGLRERSRVNVIMVAPDRTYTSISGVVVGLPSAAGASGQVSVSVELPADQAGPVAAAEKVRLVLLDPAAPG